MRKKKLTNSGTGVCVLTFIAFIFALIGSLEEFIGVFIYNIKFSDELRKLFAYDFTTYLNIYERHLSLAVISLIFFIIFCVSKRKKSVGYGIAIASVVIPIVYSTVPIINLVTAIKNDYFMDYFDSGLDETTFTFYAQLAFYVILLIACFFMLIAGLVLCCKLAGEKFTVDVPYVQKAENVQPVVQAQYVQMPSADTGYAAMGNTNTVSVNEEQTNIPSFDDVIKSDNSTMETCPNCGAELKSHAKFCSVCGQKIGD